MMLIIMGQELQLRCCEAVAPSAGCLHLVGFGLGGLGRTFVIRARSGWHCWLVLEVLGYCVVLALAALRRQGVTRRG